MEKRRILRTFPKHDCRSRFTFTKHKRSRVCLTIEGLYIRECTHFYALPSSGEVYQVFGFKLTEEQAKEVEAGDALSQV